MLNLFFPQLCCGCNRRLYSRKLPICSNCIYRLPMNIPNNLIINEFTNNFFGRVPVVYGLSLLRFERHGLSQKLLHELKYKGNQALGTYFGNWLGKTISLLELENPINLVIPVPLSKKRFRKRGYNQVHNFAKAISRQLNVPCNKKSLYKVNHTDSKVFLKRASRFTPNTNPFLLKGDYSKLINCHILVVDDTIATGATLESCAKVLLKIPGVSVSFATIAMA